MAFGRAFPIRAHTASHWLLPAQPPVRTSSVGGSTGQSVDQATLFRRPYVARQTPRPHLASPIVKPYVAPLVATKVVSQAVKRGERAFAERFLPYKVHVPRPIIARGPPLVTQPLVVRRTGRRNGAVLVAPPFLGTATPQGPVLPPSATYGHYSYQALQRPLTRRAAPVALVAAPVVGSFVPPPSPAPYYGTYVSQARQRPYTRRRVSPPLVSPALVGTPPIIGVLNVSTTIFHAPGPARSYFRVQRPKLARPVVSTTPPVFVAPAATVVLQATERAYRRRSGSVRLPTLAGQPPVQRGTVVSQAQRRPYVERAVPPALVASPLVLPPVAVVAPNAPGLFVGQARQRMLVGRRVLRPHLALPIVSAPVLAPNAVGLFLLQATERSSYLASRRSRVRVATPVLARAHVPGTLVVSQAVQRPLTRRRILPAHLPRLGVPVPVSRGTFVSQATQRPYVGRQAARTLIVGPLVTPPTTPISTTPIVYYQALRRMFVGRTVPPSPSKRYHPYTYVPASLVVPYPPITARGGTTSPTERTGLSRPRSTNSGTTSPG